MLSYIVQWKGTYKHTIVDFCCHLPHTQSAGSREKARVGGMQHSSTLLLSILCLLIGHQSFRSWICTSTHVHIMVSVHNMHVTRDATYYNWLILFLSHFHKPQAFPSWLLLSFCCYRLALLLLDNLFQTSSVLTHFLWTVRGQLKTKMQFRQKSGFYGLLVWCQNACFHVPVKFGVE